MYTWGRLGWTHGEGSSSVLLTKKSPRTVLSCPREVHQRNCWILPIFKFENRSRTTCSRFLQSFALPDEAVKLQLSWEKRWRELTVRFAPFSKISNDLHVSIPALPGFLLARFSSLISPSVGPDKRKKRHNTQITYGHRYKHTHTHKQQAHRETHVDTHVHVHVSIFLSQIINDTTTSGMEVRCVKTGHNTCTCAVTLYMIEPRTHKKRIGFLI